MYKKALLSISILLFMNLQIEAQDWTTHCGNNERNGRSELSGPHNIAAPLWTVNDAIPTDLGMNIYSFGNLFVASRVDFSPYHAVIECRDLSTGDLAWNSPDLGAESILFAMGFNEDAVYAHDYHSNLFYALNPSDGSVKWVSEYLSYTFGPMDGVIYTCERNIIINGDLGSVDQSTLCLDKETGGLVWANSNWFAVTPNETKAAHGDRLYFITGAINQPKKLTAVDMRNGESLFYSDDLPGDADQEGPITISPDGTIFFRRDGGDLYAVKDNGSGFDILWTYRPVNMGLLVINHCVDFEGNLLTLENGKVYRLSKLDGHPLDSSSVTTLTDGRIILSADSVIYINNTNGAYYALSYDLQNTLWSIPNLNGNYYSGPSLSKEGIMIVCGAGTSMTAYKYNDLHKPVAGLAASDYHILKGESVDFTDQSSFAPTSWHWEFPGGDPSVSNEKDPMDIVYAEPSVYSVTLVASNDYGSDTIIKQCLVYVEMVESIDSPVKQGETGIYPNPVNGTATLYSDQATGINIFNSLGELVYQDNSFRKIGRVDFSNFIPGIYIIKFTGSRYTKSEKVIVSR